MEVITIDSKAYDELMAKIEEISTFVKANTKSQLDAWVDNHDVCLYLKISTRTLQRLRAKGLLNYSILKGKAYYKLSEVERMMNEHLVKSSPQNFNDLVENYRKISKL